MVLDYLRFALRCRMDVECVLFSDCRDGVAGDAQAARRRCARSALSRSWKTAARIRDALGLLCFLAVSDYLVGQYPGRDEVVSGKAARWLGLDRSRDCLASLRAAVCAAALKRLEAQCTQTSDDRGADFPDALY